MTSGYTISGSSEPYFDIKDFNNGKRTVQITDGEHPIDVIDITSSNPWNQKPDDICRYNGELLFLEFAKSGCLTVDDFKKAVVYASSIDTSESYPISSLLNPEREIFECDRKNICLDEPYRELLESFEGRAGISDFLNIPETRAYAPRSREMYVDGGGFVSVPHPSRILNSQRELYAATTKKWSSLRNMRLHINEYECPDDSLSRSERETLEKLQCGRFADLTQIQGLLKRGIIDNLSTCGNP